MMFSLLHGLILLHVFTISISDEPMCSKFSFEEHLLEKMVRLEFEVEKFSKSLKQKFDEIDELKSATKTELRQLQNGREAWKVEMETLKTESIETIKKPTEFSLVYTRWGRTVCPGDAYLIYHGYAAGSHHTHSGGVADTQCLPQDPQWGNVHPGNAGSYIYGAEYETRADRSTSIFGKNVDEQDVPCAVCEVKGRKTLNMFPARTSCYQGWHLEYTGYMMTTHHSHQRGNVKCVDADPEVVPGQGDNSNGDLFYFIEAAGQLPTTSYTRGKELTCVVCTK